MDVKVQQRMTGSCSRRQTRNLPKPQLQRIATQSIDVASTNSLTVAVPTNEATCPPCSYTRVRPWRPNEVVLALPDAWWGDLMCDSIYAGVLYSFVNTEAPRIIEHFQ